MKSKVVFSLYVMILTGVILCGLIVGSIIYFVMREPLGGIILIVVTVGLLLFGALFAPIYVEVDSKYASVKSLLKKKRFRLDEIKSVELFQPTMGAIRIFASGGFMGYWGLFKEGDVGNYQAFFGKSSDCFMIRMKNGDKYVLGCRDPKMMVNEIKKNIHNLEA